MHFNAGVLFDQGRMYREAEEEYLKCVALAPEDADAHYNLGILYDDKLPAPAKAVMHYERFLALRPAGEDAIQVREWVEGLK